MPKEYPYVVVTGEKVTIETTLASNTSIPELQNYSAQRIEADGNCIFNAAIASVNSLHAGIIEETFGENTDQDLVMPLRSRVSDYILNSIAEDNNYRESLIQNAQVTLRQVHRHNIDQLNDDEIIEQYIELIKTYGQWGDHIALEAIANVFNVQIQVHSSHPIIQIGNSNRVIHLYLHGEVHYDAYILNHNEPETPLSNDDSTEIIYSVYEHDLPLINTTDISDNNSLNSSDNDTLLVDNLRGVNTNIISPKLAMNTSNSMFEHYDDGLSSSSTENIYSLLGDGVANQLPESSDDFHSEFSSNRSDYNSLASSTQEEGAILKNRKFLTSTISTNVSSDFDKVTSFQNNTTQEFNDLENYNGNERSSNFNASQNGDRLSDIESERSFSYQDFHAPLSVRQVPLSDVLNETSLVNIFFPSFREYSVDIGNESNSSLDISGLILSFTD